MHELLERAALRHGGRGQWSLLGEIAAAGVASGELLEAKGCDGPIKSFIQIDPHGTSLTFFPSGPDRQRGFFTNERVWLETLDGRLLLSRDQPGDAFAGHDRATKWDPLERLYFMGRAVWSALAMPMVFVMSGCEFELAGSSWLEVEPLTSFHVVLPPGLPSHGHRWEVFLTDEGEIRRVDYEMLGQAVSHYPSALKTVGGMAVPLRHRIVRRWGNSPVASARTELSLEFNHIQKTQSSDRLLEVFAGRSAANDP